MMASSTLQVISLLRELPLFANASETTLSTLADQCHIDRFEENAVIFYEGEICDRLWIVFRGQVKIARHSGEEREMILEILSRGEFFGGAAIFLPKHPATASAMTALETISCSTQAYTAFIQSQPIVALKLIHMLGERLFGFVQMHALTGERVERRLAHILLKLAKRGGRADLEGMMLTTALSRQDLADMTGTTIETVIRLMSRFRTDGVLKTRRGGYIVILDMKKLQDLAKE
jgi:CRP-like cAMP-binding protein